MTPTDAAIAQAFRESQKRVFNSHEEVEHFIATRARELDAAKPEQVHTCSYYCDRPECLKDQRDELRDRLEATPPAQAAEAALKVLLRDYEAVHGIGDMEMQPALQQARAAIAAMQAKP